MTKAIGVTGGIGSGKSTVCELLKSFGARVFDADRHAKRIMTEDLQVRQEVIEEFGVDSYTVSGDLNTVYLAREIFSDADKVKTINTIVHPRVLAAFSDAVELARKDGVNLMVMEAALIYESGADQLLDCVVVVDAPVEKRISRVAERDKVAERDVAKRMSHQLPPAELMKKADFVIKNDGTLEELRKEVAALVSDLTQ